jgi:ubiquinone/menaquinone biosynthesis C-methylase UbiE
MSKREVRTDYDRSAHVYEKRYKTIQWEKYEIMIDPPVKGNILDLGCGTGLLAEFLQQHITGVDISFCMLKRAKIRESVLQADIDFLPFRRHVFDAVYSFTVLQNLPSLTYVFKEVRRVLKEGSPFIFTLLTKEFSPAVIDKAATFFKISQKRICGEDTGVICV